MCEHHIPKKTLSVRVHSLATRSSQLQGLVELGGSSRRGKVIIRAALFSNTRMIERAGLLRTNLGPW